MAAAGLIHRSHLPIPATAASGLPAASAAAANRPPDEYNSGMTEPEGNFSLMADRLRALYNRYPPACTLWGVRAMAGGAAAIVDPGDAQHPPAGDLAILPEAAAYYLITLLAGNRHHQYEYCLRAMGALQHGDERQAISFLSQAMAGWDRHGHERDRAGRPGLPDRAYGGRQ
jgi:hypothetical protein